MAPTNQYKNHFIEVTATAREALKILDQLPDNDIRTLFVLDGQKVVGSLTDGDIRRGLLSDREISETVSLYMNKNFKSLKNNDITPDILKKYREKEIWFLPVVDQQMHIDRVINLKSLRTEIPASAVIMAGGRGERLRPMTDSLPKPMLRIGNKPIIEINIDRLIQFGIRKFYISIKYLGEKIVEHFGDGSAKGVLIEYIREEEPLGTIGSCSLINENEYENVLVMNSDILTNIDFEDFFRFFKERKALMCTASIPYNIAIPYGIMKMDGEIDLVTALEEKPTYTYYANAGIYFLNREALNIIPKNTHYNATDLMQTLIKKRSGLVHYPILQYWLDIGKYEDFVRAQQDYKHINF